MSADDFLRGLSTEQMQIASDAFDEVEDAANGSELRQSAYTDRLNARLARDYPAIHARVQELLALHKAINTDEAFLTGIWTGATMIAHEITIVSEIDAVNQMLNPSDSPE